MTSRMPIRKQRNSAWIVLSPAPETSSASNRDGSIPGFNTPSLRRTPRIYGAPRNMSDSKSRRSLSSLSMLEVKRGYERCRFISMIPARTAQPVRRPRM
ncbi:hypothetical protein SCLCIDRAFT_598119 [Scleroderma citrinum Foug A]|uniref:Uncharacterized protein n=1 Tax=Scleroderma citrinum Foug A TaxID=1036808 RepID=A0A0C3DWA5_9AGAM|nr:hypothetical protein SCLCIDRAFT_598119 [Scleroderma citrinum Foug A]